MKKLLYIAFILTIILNSCGDLSEDIDWEVDEIPPRLIVEGMVTSEFKNHMIKLRQSGNYFSNTETPVVSGATVEVRSGSLIYAFEESPAGSGNYISVDAFEGVPGNTYTMNIELNEPLNNEIYYTATSELVAGFRIDSLDVEVYENPFTFEDDDSDSLVTLFIMYGQEPPSVHNYYVVNYYKNDSLITDTIDKAEVIDDELAGIDGEELVIMYTGEPYFIGDNARIEFLSVNKEYTDFLNGINQISRGTDPFGISGPPANAIGNIEGGDAFGFFIASDLTGGTAQIDSLSFLDY